MFSGVLVGETFLLSTVVKVVLSSSLKLRSDSYVLRDLEGLLVFGVVTNVCLDLDEDGLDLTGEESGFFDLSLQIGDFLKELSLLVEHVSEVLVVQSDLTGDFLGTTATPFDCVTSSFSILSSSAHSISMSCSIGSI